MKDIGPEEMDYILQVLSNRVRREVIRILARESPLSYSALMKRVGIDDSGTFGFHIRKMQKLLRKDDMGEYMLNDLGRKAYEILEGLMAEEYKVDKGDGEDVPITIEADEESSWEPSTVVISDRIRFDLTEDIARSYRDKGSKLYLADIVKLRIHPMPKELFEEVVEGINDCITVQAPKELLDIVRSKSRDVLNIVEASGKPDTRGDAYALHDVDSFIGDIVSRVISATLSITNKLMSSGLRFDRMFRHGRHELVVDERLSISPGSKLAIDVSGGFVEVKLGAEGRIRVWKTGWRDPDVDIDTRDNSVYLDIGGGKCELTVPEDAVKSINIDINGGVFSLKLPNLEAIDLDISGGMAKIDSSTEEPVNIDINMNGGIVSGSIGLNALEGLSKINCDLNGGVIKLGLRTPSDTKISVDNNIFGGYASIQLDGKSVHGKYIEEGFEESSGRLMLHSELRGGLLSIFIKREKP